LEIQDSKVQPLLDAGIIEPTPVDYVKGSRFACNNVVAPKKDVHGVVGNDHRFCHNYKAINKYIAQDRYSLPLAADLHERIGDAVFFSKIDARSGFLQIPIVEEDRAKTSFWHRGQLYQYRVMPFGMKNSPVEYQRRMDRGINDHGLSAFACVFIDDILVYSKTFEEHCAHLERVFSMLKAIGIKYHPEKSTFFCEEIEYLGHMCSRQGLNPCQAKVLAIKALKPPKNLADLRRVLGFMGYYRGYVPNFSAISRPLTELTKKDRVWEWRESVEGSAYNKLKELLCDPECAMRRADASKPFILHTDFSSHGLGAVLGQVGEDGKEYMVACISRSLNKYEKEYGSYRGEMLAAVWAVRTLRYYLAGKRFTLVTDHQPLLFLMTSQDLVGQYARWSLILQEYDFEVQHRPGVKHQNADCLSRHPMASTEDRSGARAHPDDTPQPQHSAPPPVEGDKAAGSAAMAALSIALCHNPVNDDSRVQWCMDEDGEQLQLTAAAAVIFWDTVGSAASATTGDGCRIGAYAPHFWAWEAQGELDEGDRDWAACIAAALDASPDPASDEESRLWQLRVNAARWVENTDAVTAAAPRGPQLPLSPTEEQAATELYLGGLDTTTLSPLQVARLRVEGVTLFEPFGGMAAGLEAVLRNGIPVRRYIYCDRSQVAQAVASHRIKLLAKRFGPRLLPPKACGKAFTTVPQNVYKLDERSLIAAGAKDGTQWLVVAGWECQDLSPAGSRSGLGGGKSQSFYPLLEVLRTLQRLQSVAPAYLLENVAMQHTPGQPAKDYQTIRAAIGQPVLVDAARFGAGAHRVRNFWTNLTDPYELQAVLDQVHRHPDQAVLLGEGRRTQECTRLYGQPHYPANALGRPIKVLPTLVSYVGSHAFRDGREGMVIDAEGQLVPLTIEEREVALGYKPGDTAALDPVTGDPLTYEQRHAVTGACMDAHTLEALVASGLALQLHHLSNAGPTVADYLTTRRAVGTPVLTAAVCPSGGGMEPGTTAAPGAEEHPAAVFSRMVCLTAAATTAEAASGAPVDVWDDALCMEYLRQGQFTAETMEATTPQARARALKRAKAYAMEGGVLYRQLAKGERREVPPPVERKEIVQRVHERCGHFGRKRTTHLVMLAYWWAGLYKDVRAVIKCCSACHQVQATFNHTRPELNPLPMMGAFYRWHLDLAGPFPETDGGYRYVILAIEAWHKFAVLGLLKTKSASETRAFFLHNVLSVFGAPAEVVTDQGNEWEAGFHDLLTDAFIDHRTTSANHPQANGQVERLVKTVKKCLQKHTELSTSEGAKGWDALVPWIQLGYNASPHASTKHSPFQLVFAVPPTVPPNIKQRLAEEMDFDDPELAAAALLERASAVRRSCIIAGQNLAIQQQRDTLRYAKLRGAASGQGGYIPKLLRFEQGDYVYVRRNVQGTKGPNSLTPVARPEILRVLEVRDSGVLLLIGSCGRTVAENSANCSPCHLPILDTGIALAPRVKAGAVNQCCEVCSFPHDGDLMLLCDSCDRAYHTYCLTPALDGVPKGRWVCPECTAAGVTVTRLKTPQAQRGSSGARVRGGPLKGGVPALGPEPEPPDPAPDPEEGAERGRKGQRVRFADPPEQPRGGLRRSQRLAATAQVASVEPAALSKVTYTVAGLTQALEALMPGVWDSEVVELIRAGCPDDCACPPLSLGPPPERADVMSLMRSVDLSLSANVFDPFAGAGVVSTVLRERGLYVRTNDLGLGVAADSGLDGLQPSTYQSFDGRLHAVVTDAPWAALDLVVPLVSGFVRHVACFWVPSHYVRLGFEARSRFLSELSEQGRLEIVSGRTFGPEAVEYVWLVVFRSRTHRQLMLQSAA
jgi:transposase InsO family protein